MVVIAVESSCCMLVLSLIIIYVVKQLQHRICVRDNMALWTGDEARDGLIYKAYFFASTCSFNCRRFNGVSSVSEPARRIKESWFAGRPWPLI